MYRSVSNVGDHLWQTSSVSGTSEYSTELLSNHVLILARHYDVLLPPDDRLPSTFPYMIRWKRSHMHLFRTICLKHWSLLNLTLVINSFSFFILRGSSILVILTAHILQILLYNHRSNASNLFKLVWVRVQVSMLYRGVENT